jgi:dihydroorotase
VTRSANRDFVGGRVVDPSIGLDAIRTIAVRKGVVAALLDGAPAVADADVERVDCAGMVLCPGFIDPHVHLREPGETHKETFATGLAAAAAGGFTAVATMPNTRPAIDNPAAVRDAMRLAAAVEGSRCYVVGAVTRDRAGTDIAPLREMARAGAVAFSDDGATTKSLKALYNAAREIADLPAPFLSHCDDPSFEDALVNDGSVSDLLGLQGAPSVAEAAVAARDLLVARATGKKWHLCHVSAAVTIDVLRWARRSGIAASGEVTPHHLLCTDERLLGFDAMARVNPPLRAPSDAAALADAVVDGTITIFASDHAPHAVHDKNETLQRACPGFSGLETAVAATFDALAARVPLDALIANYSANPAALLGVAGGSLAPGSPADITGLYLDRPWTVDANTFKSKGRNTPFDGRRFTVRPALTVVAGAVIFRLDEAARTTIASAPRPVGVRR